MFGPHLMLDGSGCERSKLEDMALISSVLDGLPNAIGMTKIMPPYVFRYSGAVPEDWGVSGIVLIAESHISIHTFPDKGFLSVDIFSCKDFDVEFATDYMVRTFGIKDVEQQLLQRGREFPRSMGRAAKILDWEREKVALVAQ
ncbi:MAG: adenosylmethionine decarboxylase [Candidatus Sericytochromatia bacterium]|nr:adenosylmethionine decarboxylase [Candidatus Sericytochromatia bacterium]